MGRLRSPYEGREPQVSVAPRSSPWSSLKPNVVSVKPEQPQGSQAPLPPAPSLPPQGPEARVRRWRVVAACAIVAAVGGGFAWQHLHRAPAEPVRNVASGRAGTKTTPNGEPEHWTADAVTITLDPSLAKADATAKDAIEEAFATWSASDAALPHVAFDMTSAAGEAARDGVNRLLYGPITVEGHETDLAVTLTYADETTGAIVEADTIFNDAYQWSAIDPSANKGGTDTCGHHYDLQNVATHEAGHFFGLGEDMSDTTTTMYVNSSPCQTSKRTLNTSDVASMTSLYAHQGGAAAGGHKGCHHASVGGGDADGALAAAGLALLATIRRRRRA